jgi:hypothetical protein
LRTVKPCARCGRPFEGIAQARYCSDACRMQAARDRNEAARDAVDAATDAAWLSSVRLTPDSLPGEPYRDMIARLRAEDVAAGKLSPERATITPEEEERFAAIQRIYERAERHARRSESARIDSTEIIRQAREERSRQTESW